MGTYRITNAIKKSVLLQCAAYMEQALLPIFQKEDWEIFRFGQEKKNIPHVTSYDCKSDTEKMEQVFSVHHFDLMVYDLREHLEIQSMLPLEQMLQFAASYHCGKILLLSSANVFNTNQGKVTERTPAQPEHTEGRYLMRLEAFALSWKKQGLPITILRVPDMYGLGMGWKDGFAAHYLYTCAVHKPVPVYNAEERRAFLSTRDTAYAVFQTYERGYTGDYLHIAPDQSVTYHEFYKLACTAANRNIPVDFQKEETFSQALLVPKLAHQQIGWQARQNLADDISAMYKDIQLSVDREQTMRQKKRRERLRNVWKEKLIPYVENAVSALAMLGIMHLQNGRVVNSAVPFDFNFLYITIMGLLYGRRQAFLAVAFSYILLMVSNYGDVGFGLISILYSPEELLHFLSYLVIGVLSGYVAEQSKFNAQAARWQHLRDVGQYRFLRRLFEENVKTKDKLYRQIVNSQDSMGRMYHIVSALDSVEPENIYNKTALVTAEILGVSQVIIYVVGKNSAYLRQKVRIGDRTAQEPHSLKIEEYPYLQQMMRDHSIFINRDLLKGIPDLAAPIVYENRVIAIIQLYHMDFEKWSMYEMNLMAITSRLVSAALARAYLWEQETMQQCYISDTRILKEKELLRVIDKLRERRQMQAGYSAMMVKVNLPGMTYQQIDQCIGNHIRMEDYIGIYQGDVWLIFPDANKMVLQQIQERLAQGGVPTLDGKEVL